MVGTITSNMITVRKGDTFNIVLQLRHDDIPMDLSDCSIKMTVRHEENAPVVFSVVGEIFEPKEGKARIKLTPEQTNLDVGAYKTDIQLTLKNGDIHTIFPGDVNKIATFRITPEVTQ